MSIESKFVLDVEVLCRTGENIDPVDRTKLLTSGARASRRRRVTLFDKNRVSQLAREIYQRFLTYFLMRLL